MKLTTRQLQRIIQEELKGVLEEDETMGGPSNDPRYLPDASLSPLMQQWLDAMKAPAIEAAEAGGEDSELAQKFLDRLDGIGAEQLMAALRGELVGKQRTRNATDSLAKGWRRDFESEEGLEEAEDPDGNYVWDSLDEYRGPGDDEDSYTPGGKLRPSKGQLAKRERELAADKKRDTAAKAKRGAQRKRAGQAWKDHMTKNEGQKRTQRRRK